MPKRNKWALEDIQSFRGQELEEDEDEGAETEPIEQVQPPAPPRPPPVGPVIKEAAPAQLKPTPGAGPEELYHTLEEWEDLLRTTGIQPETPEQFAARQPTVPSVPQIPSFAPEMAEQVAVATTDAERVTQSLLKLFPQDETTSLENVAFFANEQPQQFLKTLQGLGRSTESENVLRAIAPDITSEQMESFWTPISPEAVTAINPITHEVSPPETKGKDIWDAFRLAATELGHKSKMFFLSDLPDALFKDVKVGDFRIGTQQQADMINTQNKVLRNLFRSTAARAKAEHDDWLEKHTELQPRPEWTEGALKNPALLKDPAYWAYEFSSNAPFMIAAMGTTVAATVAAGPVVGVLAGMAVMTPSQANDMRRLAIENGVPEDDAAVMGLAVGTLMSGVEVAGDLPLLKMVTPKLFGIVKKEAATSLMKATVRQMTKKGIRTFGAVEVTETLEEVAQQAIQNAALKSVNSNVSLLEGLSETAVQAAIATAPLAVFGGGASVSPQIRQAVDAGIQKIAPALETTKLALASETGAFVPGAEPGTPRYKQELADTRKAIELMPEPDRLAYRKELEAEANSIEKFYSEAFGEAAATLEDEPARRLINLVQKSGKMKGEISTLTKRQYKELTGKDPKPSSLTKDGTHVRWEYALDDIATELGYESDEALKQAIERVRKGLTEAKQPVSTSQMREEDAIRLEEIDQAIAIIDDAQKTVAPEIPQAFPGEPEAGIQAGMFGGAERVFPKGKGVVRQAGMDDQLKLQQMREQAAKGAAPPVTKGAEALVGLTPIEEVQAVLSGKKPLAEQGKGIYDLNYLLGGKWPENLTKETIGGSDWIYLKSNKAAAKKSIDQIVAVRKAKKLTTDFAKVQDLSRQEGRLFGYTEAEISDWLGKMSRGELPYPPTGEAVPGKAVAPAAKEPWQMNRQELEVAYDAKKAQERASDIAILGSEERLKQYERAARMAESLDTKKAAEGSRIVSEIEDSLSEADYNKFVGRGEQVVAEDYKALLDAAGQLDFTSPDTLGSSLRYAVTKVGKETDPALMSFTERNAYYQLKTAYEEAMKLRWDTRKVSTAALRGAAERFGDIEDAKFMLQRFTDMAKGKPAAKAAIAPPIETPAPKVEQGAVTPTAPAVEGAAMLAAGPPVPTGPTTTVVPGGAPIALPPQSITIATPPPAGPTIPPTATAAIPTPAPVPTGGEITRITTQSQEQVRQDKAGAIAPMLRRVPGLKRWFEYEQPGIKMVGENEKVLTAMVAENQARSDVLARAAGTRYRLLKDLMDAFGKDSVKGGKVTVAFLGTTEQAANPITFTLKDIAENPELYLLSHKQKQSLADMEARNDELLNHIVTGYNAEIGRFSAKEGGAFLPTVDISEDVAEYLGGETRAVATGRGKTRVWQTARERMAGKTPFKPELDVQKLIEGLDNYKAGAAGGQTYRSVIGGLTRENAIKETHPELYEKMTDLKKRLVSLQGSAGTIESNVHKAIFKFLNSPMEGNDLLELGEGIDVKLKTGIRAGMDVATIQDEIAKVRQEIKELRPAWEAANLKPYVFIQEGLYRYFPAEQAQLITESRQRTENRALRAIEAWRAGAFSGDLSPVIGQQGQIAILADPFGTLYAAAKGVRTAIQERNWNRAFSVEALADDIASNPVEWAQFASLSGRGLVATPQEYASGYLSKIPGFNKFTQSTYVLVTRTSFDMWRRESRSMMKAGIPELEAKVAAMDLANKVLPLVSPTRLGQSPARAAVLRAMPTSYSFIRQPASLLAQATNGLGKIMTGQKLTPAESLAVKAVVRAGVTTMGVAATSAVLTAIYRGKDDDETRKEFWKAIDPDPHNGNFASLILPVGDKDVRLPLGGPFRAIFRAVYPQEVEGSPIPLPFVGIARYLRNRVTPAVGTQLDLMLNKDYSGQQIIKGDFPENILRGLAYEFESVLPLTLGAGVEAIRQGEKYKEDVAEQMIAQFMGTNMVTLDNTYLDRQIKKLGLPDPDAEPEPYSIQKPKLYNAKDLFSDARWTKDLTIEEMKKRDFDPKIIAIAEAREAKKQMDSVPDLSLSKINADPSKGDTFFQFYDQAYQRKLITDPKALEAFDKKYPNANLGNMSQNEYVLLQQYHDLSDKGQQADFLKQHPELGLNKRNEWLKSHPKDNALLALHGQAKVLSEAAYKEVKGLIKKLDYPDDGIPPMTLPPEKSVETHFKYEDMVAEGKQGSWEAQLLLAKDKGYTEWRGLKGSDTPVAALELRVKNRANFDKEEELKGNADALKKFRADNPAFIDDTRRIEAIEKGGEQHQEAWVKRGKTVDEFGGSSSEAKVFFLDNPEVHQWALTNKLVEDDGTKWNAPALRLNVKLRKQDAEYNALPTTGDARKQYMADNSSYRKDDRRREAYQSDFPATEVENYVGYYELPVKGKRQDRFLVENPAFARMMAERKGIKLPDPKTVPSVQYDDLYDQHKDKFEQYEILTGDDREAFLRRDAKFADVVNRREAYSLLLDKVNPKHVGDYVEHYKFPDAGMERELHFAENSEFEKALWMAKNPKANPALYKSSVEKHIESLRISVKYKDLDFQYANATPAKRQQLLSGNPQYARARYMRQGYDLKFPDDMVPKFADYSMIPEKGWAKERYRKANPKFDLFATKVLKWEPLDYDRVPSQGFENLYEQYQNAPPGNARRTLRWNNPDFDAEGEKLGYWTKLSREPGGLSASDKKLQEWWDSLSKMKLTPIKR